TRSAGQIRERPRGEVLQPRVALVEAPPHAPGERLHLVGCDLVPPRPRQRAFAHAADGDEGPAGARDTPHSTDERPSRSASSVRRGARRGGGCRAASPRERPTAWAATESQRRSAAFPRRPADTPTARR